MAAQHSHIHRDIVTAIILCVIGLPAAAQYGGGTGDIWWIVEGRDYPRLSWERQEQP